MTDEKNNGNIGDLEATNAGDVVHTGAEHVETRSEEPEFDLTAPAGLPTDEEFERRQQCTKYLDALPHTNSQGASNSI